MRTLTFALLLLAACSTGSGAAGGDPAATGSTPGGAAALPLTETRWNLAAIGGMPAVARGTERDPWLRLGATEGRVAGSTGCNSMGGSFETSGDRLTFGPLITTRMACVEENLMAQESRLLAALDSVARFAISADTLSLLGAEGAAPTLRFTAGR